MDITGPYKFSPRKKNSLTFIDNFSKSKFFPFSMTVQTMARVYPTQSRDMAQDQN